MASKGKPKRASPKVRKTAELYKSSHNIGNRTARMRVGNYKDTEFAVEYPEGFWDPVKPSDASPERGRGAVAENHSPTRVASPPGAKSAASPQKASKSASGATKRKLDDKPEVNGIGTGNKKATPKAVVKTEKKSDKNKPKTEKTPKNEISNKPTKEVKIILEKHPGLNLKDEKKVLDNKEKVNKGKDNKKEGKEKKLSKEMNGEKEKKVIKDKKEKQKGKTKEESKNEIKKDKKKKQKTSTKVEEKSSDEKSENSSDYTYDSDDSEMEISFKKRKTETPVKTTAKESTKAKGGKKIQPKAKDSSSDNNRGSSSNGKAKKAKSNKIQKWEPRAPRIKRTACLNANAIVSALYQTEDTSSNTKSSTSANRTASPAAAAATASSPGPTSSSTPRNSQSSRSVSPASRASRNAQPKRRKISIDADLDDGGDEAFDMYMAEYEEMVRETTTKPLHPSKPSKRQTPTASPKKDTSSSNNKEPSSPKKAAAPKKESSKKDAQKRDSSKKKESSKKRDSGGSSNAYDFESDEDVDLGPVPGLYKPQFNRDKSPKKYEIMKKSPKSPEREPAKKTSGQSGNKKGATPTSSGGKKESSTGSKKESAPPRKESTTAKGKKKPPPKKDESSSDEFDSSSESEVEEEEKKKEEDVPLWPPPKRMASLNASAMMAASTDRNVRKSIDKSPSRLNETKKDKAKDNAEEKTKEKEKDKKAEDFSERPDKREKSPVKKVEGVRSDGKAEAKVSPMRSSTSQASPGKQQNPQPDQNRRSNEQQYTPIGGTGSPSRGPGHWVQGMVSPPKAMGGTLERSVGGAMKPPLHSSYDPRSGPMAMPSASPDVQMMSQNYPRYPPMPTASPEVQVVEVQRTGYYQGYPHPRQQYPGYDRHQALGHGYHQGLPPPAHYYPGARGPQGSYAQPPAQYSQSYPNQQSSGQGSGHGGQNGLYPLPPAQHHSSYSSSTHNQQSRVQDPPPAHQHRQQPPYLEPQQQSSHGYGALHSMQQRYGAQSGPYPPGHQQQNKSQSAHPNQPPAMYPQQNQQLSPGQQQQQPKQQQQMSPGQAPNRGQSQSQQQQQSSQSSGGSGGGGSYQQSGSSGSAGSNGSSSGSSSRNSSASSSSAGGASGSTSSSGASGAGTGAQQDSNSSNNNTTNNTNGSVADSNSVGVGSSAINEFTNRNSPMSTNTAAPYPSYPHNSIVPSQGGMQYPYAGSMSSSSSYRMMLSRGPFNTSAFTSPPGYHHSYGYYQSAGPMMQALGEACCIQPMPYHFHQQQVKVLVHNPIIPGLHPFGSPMGPSIIEIPRETKPSALISPQRLPLTGPGGSDDGNNQAQQQDAQQQHSQQSPQLQPESSQPPKPNLKELPDQKSDIKEPVMGIGEDKKAQKRNSSGTNTDNSVVCKTESDKRSGSEPNAKSIKLGKDSSKVNNSSGAQTDSKISVRNSGQSSSGKKCKGENQNSDKNKDKSNAGVDTNTSGKKKKSKDGKSKKPKDGEKPKEKKKKKKKQKGLNEGEPSETGEKKKKKKKKLLDGGVAEGANGEKVKKIKKKKKKKNNLNSILNGTNTTATDEKTPDTNPTGEKPKKKKKKSKDKTGGTKASTEDKPKKKKVVSSKKKLSSAANPESPNKGQEKNVAKGTKSEAKAKKAGTSTTSTTNAEQESVSPNLTLLSSRGQPGSLKSTPSSGNPSTRATASPGSKAAKITAEQAAQGSISPLAALSSPKSVSGAGNPKGVTSLSIEVSEGSGTKAKNSSRKTPSPGKSTVVSPTPALPPPAKYARKTPSPKSQPQNPLKVDVELATKGRKTPSPSARKTPSPSARKTPSPSARKTPSPGAKKTASPSVTSRKTPSPNTNRKTPSPNVGKKSANPPGLVPVVSGSPVTGRKTPSPNKALPGPSASPKPGTSPKSANLKPPLTNPKGSGTNPSPKPAASKDGKSPKAKVKKSPGATATNKDKTAAKSKKKSDKIKVLKTKTKKDISATGAGSVTKKIKKKNLKNIKKKLKVVLGLHAKSAKLGKPHASPLKKSLSPPKAKSPIQATGPSQSPRATALTTPKKLPSSPQSGGKPRPRIDDIARRLSIENRERREEKKLSGKESPGLKDGSNGKKDKNGEVRRKEEKAMRIKMVPVICPWSWKGEPELKQITNAVDSPGVQRKCYPAIRHKVDGDVINVRDCVLVRSGPKKSDVPYIAKIAALWENDAGDMMMSLLWYYRPEHTDSDRLPRHVSCEIFASKHWDQTSVACIDDRCHVLTFNEYCRFKANQKQHMEGIPLRVQLVPAQEDRPITRRIMPSFEANPETVFLCRRVYDFKMKRILKNPT